MKQLSYTIRYLLRTRSNNLIKVISLTLGLVVALVLFSQVAFELSYDKFYPDADRLYSIQRKLTMNRSGEEMKFEGPVINAPVPGAMKDDLRGVEMATVMGSWTSETKLMWDNKVYVETTRVVDSTFFDLFGYKLLAGNKELLSVASNIFLSESAAKRIFGSTNPVGQTLLWDKKDPVTVAGIFEDIPENTHLEMDAVIPFKTLTEVWGARPGWMNNDAYWGYVKLSPGVTPKEIEAEIPAMLPKYYDVDAFEKKGFSCEYFLKPVVDLHSTDPVTQRMIHILSALALSLLVVSAMNYVLISISSLAIRAKSIGVHKCSGASSGHIFSMFIYETLLLVLLALLLSGILLVIFRTQVESLVQTSLLSIFSLDNLWVTLAVIMALVLIAGVIPARIFCSIPVTQVFRTYTANKRLWKQVLLFVQFTGIAFMLSLLLVIVRQYSMMMNKDMGYTTENIVFGSDLGDIDGELLLRLKTEFKRMPQVVSATVTIGMPSDGLSGTMVSDEKGENLLFSTRFLSADKDFFETFRIPFKEGVNFQESKISDKVIVNEDFVRRMSWQGSPIGKTFMLEGKRVELIGVVKDFQIGNLYNEPMPLVIAPKAENEQYWGWGQLVLRLDHLDPSMMAELDATLRKVVNNDDAYFSDYRGRMEFSYQDARLFRDSIFVSAGIMLIITLLGLLGYTEDEIHRRSKEIAIRKVNGATAGNILMILSKGISLTAIPAILIGIGFAYKIGSDWLMQFAEKIPLTVILFSISGLAVLAIIIVSIQLRALQVANENPVKSIKSE